MNASKTPHPAGAASRQGEVETPPPAAQETAVTAAGLPEEAQTPREAAPRTPPPEDIRGWIRHASDQLRCICGHLDVFHNLSTDNTRRTACSWHDAPEGPCPCKTFTPRTEADPS